MPFYKILWLTENYYPNKGGMAQSCDRITHNLRKTGIFIHIFHFTNRRKAFKTELQQNGKYTALPIVEDSSHTINLAWNYISTYSDQYTHFVSWGVNLSVIAGPIFSQWLNLPYIFTIRGNDFDANIFSLRKRESLLYAINCASAVCCVSKQKLSRIQKLAPEAKLYYTPNGLDSSDWKAFPSDYSFSQKWKETHFSAGKILIGIAGILKAKKGVSFFIEAIKKAMLIDSFQILTLGDLPDEFSEILIESGIEFKCLPFMESSELIPYYIACDIIAIPSFYEGMPNVLLEAGLLGKTFIASYVDGMADVLSHDSSFLFPPGNIQGCINQLKQLAMCNPSLLGEKGATIKLNIESNFTEMHEICNYLKAFGGVLQKERACNI